MNLPPEIEPEAQTQTAGMSLPARMLNVYAAPGEVFDNVRSTPPRSANWTVPALILIIVSIVFSVIIFRQPDVQQQLREVSARAMERQFAKTKMSEQQKQQALAVAEKWSVIGTQISAFAAPPFSAAFHVFGLGLVFWLIGAKIMNGGFPYMKAAEAAGLCCMITTLDVVLRSLLILLTTNLWASLSPTLLIRDFDPQNPAHQALGMLNLMTFWALIVKALALSKLSRKGFGAAFAWIFGLWLAWNAFSLGISAISHALMNR